MRSIFETICFLSKIPQITSYEKLDDLKTILSKHPILKNAEIDQVGNIILCKKGNADNPKKILLEAHRDEIGLCVKEILDDGFVSILPCGGVSADILPGTEFIVYGKGEFRAIATSIPPHLKKADEKKERLKISDVYLDMGMKSKSEVKKRIRIGDPIRFAGTPEKLLNDKICSPALDNKASMAALLLTYEKLGMCKDDVYFLFSVGEETTSRGVRYAVPHVSPDLALILDAGFAMAEGLCEAKCIEAGFGPSVSYTDTLSNEMSDLVFSVAERNGLSIQKIAEPGGTGTSATAIQLENGGTPTAVISIPVFNMHTPSEIVKISDIEKTTDLLCAICQSGMFQKEEI